MLIGGFCGRGDLLVVIQVKQCARAGVCVKGGALMQPPSRHQNATLSETAVDHSEAGLVVVGRLVDMIEVSGSSSTSTSSSNSSLSSWAGLSI